MWNLKEGGLLVKTDDNIYCRLFIGDSDLEYAAILGAKKMIIKIAPLDRNNGIVRSQRIKEMVNRIAFLMKETVIICC